MFYDHFSARSLLAKLGRKKMQERAGSAKCDARYIQENAGFDFIECFTTTFLRAHSWLNWVERKCRNELDQLNVMRDSFKKMHNLVTVDPIEQQSRSELVHLPYDYFSRGLWTVA